MKTTNKHLLVIAGFALALIAGSVGTLQAENKPGNVPKKKAVTGGFDWSIVPANLGPYLIPGTDGDLYLRNMPLVGVFTLSGEGLTISAKISVQLSGELDVTGTGVLWSPTVLTATINGIKTIIFEGTATADTVGLVSTGKVTLNGRGPYAGTKLEFVFQEIGPGNTDTYTLTGHLSNDPQ